MRVVDAPFVFLRHGETDWNLQGLTQGRTDIPLNQTGLDQAQAAAHLLAGQGITRIVSSTLGRARQTAAIVGAALGLAVQHDADLCEANFGDQEGRTMGAWYDDWVVAGYTPAGGETFAALQLRVVAGINSATEQPGLVLIVAHGAMFRALRAAMGLSAHVRTENGVPLRCTPGNPWTLTALPT